jgi:hypothetical protein
MLPIYTKWGRLNTESDPLQCGVYFPDFVWELVEEQRVVILECDENAHRSYTVRCELARPIKMALGYGGRPVYMLRYNPDMLAYVKSMPGKKEREAILLSRMQDALGPAPQDDSCFKHILTIEFLFYYDIPGSTVTAPYVQTIAFNRVDEYEEWAEANITKFEGEQHRAATRVATPSAPAKGCSGVGASSRALAANSAT